MPDPSVPHVEGNGFNKSVCKGCPHHVTGLIDRCGLCGCPTARLGPMSQLGAPPENCPNLVEHARADQRRR